VLRGILETALEKLTQRQIVNEWPQESPRPARTTLWRWLDLATRDGRLLRDGEGTKRSPFRYWLPGGEEEVPMEQEHTMPKELTEMLETEEEEPE